MSVSPVQIAGDIALYILQNEGVLFSSSRQEIHYLNTTATFIWLCLEDGLTVEATVDEYAEAFDVPEQEATELALTSLRDWQCMGYLWGVGYPDRETIGFNTALGRLLTNPVLREAFARDTPTVAKQLNVSEADYGAFVTLDPTEVEIHARLLISKKLGRRHAAQKNAEARKLYTYCNDKVSPLGRDAIEQHYHLLNTRFVLRFPSVKYAELVETAFTHMRAGAPQEADVQFELLVSNNRFLLLENLEPVRDCSSLSGVVPMINAALRRTVAKRHPHFLHIHAGVVAGKTACMLLPGSSGSGKTTLTAGLSRNNYQYYSDEIALLVEADQLSVPPVPLSMTIKHGAVSVLANYYDGIENLPIHTREDDMEVRYLPPTIDSLPPAADCLKPVAAIVFPEFKQGVPTRLDPIAKTRALSMLLEECMDIPELLTKQQVSDLIAWIEQLDCYVLAVSDLEEAIGLLQDLDL